MSAPLVWVPRKQWAVHARRGIFGIDVAITKSEAGFTWWIDVLDRGVGQSLVDFSAQPPARSLAEAKRRASEQVDALIERLTRARGGL